MKKVIANKNLPAKSPVIATLSIITALHYWNASTWLWIICTVLLIFEWGLYLGKLAGQQEIEIADHMVDAAPKPQTFKEKLEELQLKQKEEQLKARYKREEELYKQWRQERGLDG